MLLEAFDFAFHSSSKGISEIYFEPVLSAFDLHFFHLREQIISNAKIDVLRLCSSFC